MTAQLRPDTDILVEVRHLSKSFPGVRALQDVNLRIRRGGVHAIVGENGAGKSTLIKILTGVYAKDSGEILLDGRPVEITSPAEAQRLGLAAIYQEVTLVPNMSVAENITLGRHPDRFGLVDRPRMDQRAGEALAMLDERIDLHISVRRLSTALQQMVTVAKTLAQEARILIMDEPTAALPQREIERLFRVIRRLRAQGVTFIYISHRLEEIFQIADWVTILRDGGVVGDFAVSEVDIDRVISLMIGRQLREFFPRDRHEIGEELLRVEHFSAPPRFEDVSLTLRAGEILGIAGMVGSGRTELVRALFGADPIVSGRLVLSGREVRLTDPRKAIANGIGLLPEERKAQALVLSLSVRDNVSLAILDRLSRLGLIDLGAQTGIVSDLVRRLDIRTPNLRQLVMYLSGGNQQKTVLARWLASRSSVLIFDEPTRGIDVGTKAEIYRLMSAICGQGGAIIMVSSDMPELLSMSDRILVMRQGRMVGELARAAATEERVLNLALGVEAHSAGSAIS